VCSTDHHGRDWMIPIVHVQDGLMQEKHYHLYLQPLAKKRYQLFAIAQ